MLRDKENQANESMEIDEGNTEKDYRRKSSYAGVPNV